VLFPALIFALVLSSAWASTVFAMWIVPTDTPAALATSGVVCVGVAGLLASGLFKFEQTGLAARAALDRAAASDLACAAFSATSGSRVSASSHRVSVSRFRRPNWSTQRTSLLPKWLSPAVFVCCFQTL